MAASSTAPTVATTVTTAPTSGSTTTGRVNLTWKSRMRPGSPAHSTTGCTARPIVSIPWARTPGEADRGRDVVAVVDRVEVARGAGVAHEESRVSG